MNSKFSLTLVLLLSFVHFQASFGQILTMPPGINVKSGSSTCSGTFFDAGGGNGNYPNNQKSKFIICPNTPGNRVQVTFSSFDIEPAFDSLVIVDRGNYTGNSLTEPNIIGVFWGTNNPGTITATNPDEGGCLTFYFSSDGSINGPGWTATFSCVPCSAPTALCKPATVQLDGNGGGTLLPADVDNNSLASCGLQSLSVTPDVFDCAQVGPQTVTLTVTNVNNDISTCNTTVTVQDITSPVISCVTPVNIPVIRNNDLGQCYYTAQGTEFDATATDNCGVASLTNNYNNTGTLAGETFPVGTTQVLWTALDAASNLDTCSIKIVVTDNEPPVITCQDITLQLDASGSASILNAAFLNSDVLLSANDNCGGVTSFIFLGNSAPFTCDNVGIPNLRTISKQDFNGNNSASCPFNVTVLDTDFPCNAPPTAVCANITVDADGNCQGNAVAADFDGGSSDPDGDGLTFSVDLTGPYPLGMTDVVLTVDDGNGETDNCAAIITVVDNSVPTALCRNITIQLDLGGTVSITESQVDNGSNDACGILNLAVNPNSFNTANVGDNSVTLTATDNNGNTANCTANVNVDRRTTSLINLGVFSGQYSDQVTLRALLVDAIPVNPLSGKTVNFTIGTQSTSATTNASGIATATITLDQAPGADFFQSSFAGDATFKASSDSDPFSILQEDALVTYTGALLVSTAGQNSSVATVTLAATIQDISDDYAGDIQNACVTFIDRETNTIIASGLPVVLIDPNDPTVGSVVFNWENVDIGNADFDEFEIGIIVGCYYTRNDMTDNVMVTVSKPLDNFITGGGYLLLANSGGTQAGDAGTRMNFSVNVKFNPAGTKPKGRVQFLVRRLESDGIVHTYRFKSNNLTSLGIDPDNNTATVNGKLNIQDVTDPNNPISLIGNNIFQVTLHDNGEPGFGDVIGFTVYDNGGGLLFSSSWTGTITAEQNLAGGNLKVHTGGNGNANLSMPNTGAVTMESNQESVRDQIQLEIAPNPARSFIQLNVVTQLPGTLNLQIINLEGKIVQQQQFTAEKGQNRQQLDISQLSPGIHIVRIIGKGSMVMERFVKI